MVLRLHGEVRGRFKSFESAMDWLLEHQELSVHNALHGGGWSIEEGGRPVTECPPRTCWRCDLRRREELMDALR